MRRFSRFRYPLAVLVLVTALLPAPAGGADTAGTTESDESLATLYRKTAPSVIRLTNGRRAASGVILTADGLAVTSRLAIRKNEHTARLADGTRVEAHLLLRDERTGLAIVRLRRTDGEGGTSSGETAEDPGQADPPGSVSLGWPALAPSSAKDLPTGSRVATVAHPSHTDAKHRSRPSFSVGVLAARGKISSDLEYSGDLLMTDASANPGSAGGALVDSAGELAGILLRPSYHADTDTALNLALPADVLPDLIRQARETPDPPIVEVPPVAERDFGFLGITRDDSTERCRVARVLPRGPAAKSGILPGDVITAIDGEPVETFGDLVGYLRRTEPGQEVQLTIERAGHHVELSLTVVLGAYESGE